MPGSCMQKFDLCIAWFFIFCGLFVICIFAYTKIVEIADEEGKDDVASTELF